MTKATGKAKVRLPGGKTVDATVGPDVDLDVEIIHDGRGGRFTHHDADELVATAKKSAGRPSLTGVAGRSPVVGFRLTPELRARAETVAKAEGKTLSALAREAFLERLNRSA